MKRLPDNTALIVIDVQKAFDDPRFPPRNNPQAEANIARVLAAWRERGRPVIHVKHDSVEPESLLRPGLPGNEIKPEAMPKEGEPVLHKNVNSAFIGTDLEQRLRSSSIDTVVLVGFTTNHCVSTTARMAGNLGFSTYLLSHATAAFDTRTPDGRVIPAEQMHEVGLAELHGEFATVLPTSELLALLDGAN